LAVAFGFRGQIYYAWDVYSGKAISVMPEQNRSVRSLFFAPDGRTLATLDHAGRVLHWDLVTGKPTPRQLCNPKLRVAPPFGAWQEPKTAKESRGDDDPVLAPDFNHYATGGTVFDMITGRRQYTLADKTDLVAFTSDGKRFIRVRGLDVNTFDLATGTAATFAIADDRPGARIARIASGGTGPYMAAVHNAKNRDEDLTLCQLDTGKPVWTIPIRNNYGVQRLTVSQDWVAVQYEWETRLINTATGKVKYRMKMSSWPFHYEKKAVFDQSLVFSPDGRCLVDAPYGVWEVATGTIRWRFPRSDDAPLAVTFAPDGEALAGNTTETSVLLWSTTFIPRLPRAKALSDHEQCDLWNDLASAQGATAWKAIGTLRVYPDQAAALLGKQPAATTSPEQRVRIARLLAELDGDQFEARDQAQISLGAMGRQILSFAKQELQENPSLEKRRRLEALCNSLLDGPYNADELRALRAIELLEKLATPPARALLTDWSLGDVDAVQTTEVAAALARLAFRSKKTTPTASSLR
jgi:hypothetical protein